MQAKNILKIYKTRIQAAQAHIQTHKHTHTHTHTYVQTN